MFDTPSANVTEMRITLDYAQEKIDGAITVRLKAS